VAYLVKAGRRDVLPRVWAGVTAAVAVSLAFGALLTYGPRGLTWEAQEAIGGTLSIVAVAFVTWMIFWMAGASRTLSRQLRDRVDVALDAGKWSLAAVAALAVGREGLETALFLWAATNAATSDGAGATDPLVGAALGIAVAVGIGYLMYRGAVTINLGAFFRWTGAFLIVTAGGVLAYGVHDLQEAGIVGGLNDLLFDVSAQVPPGSWYGTLLKGIFNFSPQTTEREAAAWLGYVVIVGAAFWWKLSRAHRPARADRTVSHMEEPIS